MSSPPGAGKQQQQQQRTATPSPVRNNNKSAEERDKEFKDAKEQLKQLLSHGKPGKPRNLGEGVMNGVSTIVRGAIGGATVAALAPTMGLVTGTSGGGIVGGAVGVVVGAVVGIVGGTAIAVSSAIGGVVHIGRGVAAVPSSISKPAHGYWWNESTHTWDYTNISSEQTKLQSIPMDDSDILRQYEDDLDASGTFTTTSDQVIDPYYYECLDIPTTAEPALIKRRYYLLARKYHPDKVGSDDAVSAEKFKQVAEAYQVLIDPELRKRYDKDGRAGLSPDKTSTVDNDMNNPFANIDPALLFAFLFGSDKFHSYVGRYVFNAFIFENKFFVSNLMFSYILFFLYSS
jgi:DnaJ domain